MEASVSLYRTIRRLYRLGQRYFMSHMEHPELTPSELSLLRHVGYHGEVSQRHLAEDMNVDKAMVTRVLQKLESKGYLVRTEDENDARSKKVTALPPAKKIHSESRGVDEEFSDMLTEGFSDEEIALLNRLLGQMLERARRELL